MVSLPIMILIISLAAICKPSYFNLIVIIGVLQSANITRIVRAEMLRIKNLDYMQAAEIIGLSKFQILIKHALPNTISPAISSISFGVAQSILIESSLSFLNVGLPVGVVSWGSLINSGCDNFNAWWLIILPGLAIFITVLIFNILGSALHKALLINAE
jgi:peptide/nickel transport system permease protein